MKYKMVCIDMDGTLLGPRKRISKKNKSAIKMAHDKGIEIVVTTGRIYNNAAYFSNLLGVKSPVIAANGAIVLDEKNNEVIYQSHILTEDCIKLLDILDTHRTFYQFYTDDTIYCNNWVTKISTRVFMTKQTSFEHLKVNYINIQGKKAWVDLFKSKRKEIVKCVIVSPNKRKINEIRSEISKLSNIIVFGAGEHSLEVNYKTVSKGNAVRILGEKYNIKKEEIICIGDNENDISMIEYAGVGIAMGNAIQEVKEKADYITDSNGRDGVAKAINKFVLSKEEM